MPRYYPNIEPSAFHPGEYVGYGGGAVWRIRRLPTHSTVGKWIATAHKGGFPSLYAYSLQVMQWQLESVKPCRYEPIPVAACEQMQRM